MTTLKRLLALTLLLFAFEIQAYTLASFDQSFNWKRPTDLFIVGYGNEAGTLFINTAITRARKQLDTFGRERQILIIWAKEKEGAHDSRYVENLGLNVLYSSNDLIDMDMTIAWADKLKTITSMHFVGHSNAWGGSVLQKNINLTQDAKKLSKLKRKFTDDAFIFLHGCNSGFKSAPELSAIFEVPVFGSLTSTDFQQLHNDESWYWNNKGQYPSGGWTRTNNLSFNTPKNCSGNACYRLKANNHPYGGTWGRYETGLPFHKAFCNFDLSKVSLIARKKAIDTCYGGIWNALKTWPSVAVLNEYSSEQTFKKVMIDYLCPKMEGRSIDQTCEEVLDAADRKQSTSAKFFWGAQLNCSIHNCQWQTKKVPSDEYGQLTVFLAPDVGNKTLIEEYELYKKVFNHFSR